jgi:Protein of unknown function (DUF5818)
VSRETGMLATAGFLMALVASGFGQELRTRPGPALPANVLGPQLVVWSQAQQPRPVPQPLPDPPEEKSAPQEPEQSANSQAEQRAATQTITGTIMKDGTKYFLKESSGTTYEVDDQDKAKQYDGKQVKIVGALDANRKTLHIASIQLIS